MLKHPPAPTSATPTPSASPSTSTLSRNSTSDSTRRHHDHADRLPPTWTPRSAPKLRPPASAKTGFPQSNSQFDPNLTPGDYAGGIATICDPGNRAPPKKNRAKKTPLDIFYISIYFPVPTFSKRTPPHPSIAKPFSTSSTTKPPSPANSSNASPQQAHLEMPRKIPHHRRTRLPHRCRPR